MFGIGIGTCVACVACVTHASPQPGNAFASAEHEDAA